MANHPSKEMKDQLCQDLLQRLNPAVLSKDKSVYGYHHNLTRKKLTAQTKPTASLFKEASAGSRLWTTEQHKNLQ